MSNLADDSLRGVEMTEHLKLYHSVDGTLKGIIMDHQHHRVVGTLPIPDEFALPSQQNNLVSELTFPLVAFSSVEGSLIRVYYFNDEWQISTSSRIDAYESSWAEKASFGAQFEDYICSITGTPLDVFLCSLNQELKYFFLLPTTGLNRLGKLPTEETKQIFLVAIELPDGTIKCGQSLDTTERNAWSYFEEHTFTEFNALVDFVKQDHNLILYLPTGRIIKCVSDAYQYRCNLRDNEMNLTLRYVQLLKTEPEKCNQLAEMYPDLQLTEGIRNRLNQIVRYIHSSYITRYVKREYVLLPKVFFQIMKRCHQNYIQTHEKTTANKVYDTIIAQEPKIILSLIRNFPLIE